MPDPSARSNPGPASQVPAKYLALALEMIPIGSPLPFALFVKTGENYRCVLNEGDRLTASQVVTLQDQTRGTIYIERRFLALLTEQVEAIHQRNILQNSSSQFTLRDLLVLYGQNIHRERMDFKRHTFDKLEVGAIHLAVALDSRPDLAFQLLRRSQDPVLYFVNHSTNVAIYSVAIGRQMGLSLNDLKLLACGALVHDIGNLFLPADVLSSLDELKQEEEEFFRSHTTRGGELLQAVGAPLEVVAIAKQHHERWDGSGYPLGLRGVEIHPMARIVSVADALDDLTTKRPRHAPVSYENALALIVSAKAKNDLHAVESLAAILPSLVPK